MKIARKKISASYSERSWLVQTVQEMESMQPWDSNEAQTDSATMKLLHKTAQDWGEKQNLFCVFPNMVTLPCSVPADFLLIQTNIPHLSLLRTYCQYQLTAGLLSDIIYPVLSWDQKTRNNAWHATIFLTLPQCFRVSLATHKTHWKKNLYYNGKSRFLYLDLANPSIKKRKQNQMTLIAAVTLM